MPIILTEDGGTARKLERTVIEKEEFLQRYIYQNPEALPLEDYKEGVNLLVLAREFPTGSGPIDAVAVDQDGEVYLIETKLYKNPDKRFVLAQVLDYGASLWKSYSNPEAFLGDLQQRSAALSSGSLKDVIERYFEFDSADADQLLGSVAENVEEGNFRFVILMDRLEDRLRDLIQFMNQNSRFDVFGVELDFYRHERLEILIPRLYGAEVKKAVGSRSAGQRRKWTKDSFFKDVGERLSPEGRLAVERLYQWSEEAADWIRWGTGVARGSFNVGFHHICPRSVFTVFSDGTLDLNFGWVREGPGADCVKVLGEKLRTEGAIEIPGDFEKKHVGSSVKVWGGSLEKILTIFEEILRKKPLSDETPGV